MPIQLVTVVSQLVPSAMVVDVHTGHVTPSTMHMDPCRLWQTLLLHPLGNIPPSPTQWDIIKALTNEMIAGDSGRKGQHGVAELDLSLRRSGDQPQYVHRRVWYENKLGRVVLRKRAAVA